MSKSQAFYGFLIRDEIDRAIAESLSRYELTLIESRGKDYVPLKSILCACGSTENDISERVYIVCSEAAGRLVDSLDPPPNIIVDFPKSASAILGKTWISYKLRDADLESECAAKVISCYRHIIRQLKKLLIGHTIAYFSYDPQGIGRYPQVRYSAEALKERRAGREWRSTPGGAIFEPADK
jgi:hypothetical protein